MTGCAILRLGFPPSAAEEDAFLLRIDAAQPQEIAERRCAAEACFAEKSTSLKARRARDFKSKGVLLHTFALVYLILLYTTQQQAKTKKKKQQQQKKKKKKTGGLQLEGAGLKHVIVSEKRNKKAAKYQASK